MQLLHNNVNKNITLSQLILISLFILQPINEVDEAGTSAAIAESDTSPGHHSCDICGKIFQFRYQLIVHRYTNITNISKIY